MKETSPPPASGPAPTGSGPGPAAALPGRNAALLLFVVCAVQFLDAMDIASMGPALPQIQRELNMSPDELQWVISGYTLGFGSVLLLGGRLADLLGRKKLLIGWLLVFTVASSVGGLTHGSVLLVAARLFKGISAGFTAPVAMAVLLDAFREEKARNRALGAFLAITTVGYSAGLVLGGLLTGLTWRLVLFLPAVVAAVVAGLAHVAVPRDHRSRERRRGRIDVLGAVLVTSASIMLVHGVTRAPAAGWGDTGVIGSLVGAAAVLAVFVVVERAHPSPLIPFAVFTRPHLVRANACILMFGAYVAFQFVLTLYYQNELGWSPLEAGLAFLLGAALTGVTARHCAAAVTRYGAWPVATTGLLMLAAGYLVWALLIGHAGPLPLLFAQQVLGGIGFAAAYTALNIAAVGHARDGEQGLVSGLFNASAQIGAGVVLAATATMVTVHAGQGLGGYRAGLWTIGAVSMAITVAAGAKAVGRPARP
ncbi:MFS transporter [Sphaerisporangium fuscum]|uniref:MFS transporter n=1 Tax=Sphaerisporangium fuscum TaxID=2835868 RepID=UPI001BDBF91F|nr:MFS transporter [Sphaerisporangium fuscum]